ncbi:fructose-2,6-bisphosphatase [Burkholderiales bacterium JOSHI_001]|nr:fructose-2,6-bisphosphatase [Burkholderiales bacterium JOSHI_001]
MSDITRIVAIRHGETAWNVDTRLQGQLDIPLNDTGRWQAARLAAALADEQLDLVYASDLSRAMDTALALARPLGLPVRAEPLLRERAFGVLEGLTYQQVDERHPQDALRWRHREPTWGPAGGETLQAFAQRCVAAVERLAQAHRGQTLAVVAHGGVLDCLYRAATRIAVNAPRTWQLGNASINRLLHSDQGLALVGWNDTGHLECPGSDDTSVPSA